MKRKCPTCRHAAALGEENLFRPFCSERCKLVDLSKWLDGTYSIPGAETKETDVQPIN